MVAVKKTLQQQIDETKTKLKALQSLQKQKVLEKTSSGMDQLLAALDVVIEENKCTVFDVLKSVSRIRKTGAKIEPPTKKPRVPKVTEGGVKSPKTTKTLSAGQTKRK